MTAKEIYDKIIEGKKINVIDIRQKDRYDHFHIPGAIHIEKGKLIEAPEKFLNKQEKYYITCNSGNSAKLVVQILQINNWDAQIVDKGMSTLNEFL